MLVIRWNCKNKNNKLPCLRGGGGGGEEACLRGVSKSLAEEGVSCES